MNRREFGFSLAPFAAALAIIKPTADDNFRSLRQDGFGWRVTDGNELMSQAKALADALGFDTSKHDGKFWIHQMSSWERA